MDRQIKILVTDRYPRAVLEQLRATLNCQVSTSQSPQPSMDELEDCQGLLIRSRTAIDASLGEAKSLKFVASATSGFDHIDLKFCQERAIRAVHAPEAQVPSVAEHTLFLLLSLLKHPNLKKPGTWRDPHFRGHELKGLHLGLVGLGRIGKEVARWANALGMEVSAYDPYIPQVDFQNSQAQRLGFTELLRHSDVVSFHVPLTSETRFMMTNETFAEMNHHSLIINTCRGSVIREYDLIAAMENKTIGGAALDVFEKEPLPIDSKLFTLPNVVLSAHVAAYSEEAWQRSSQMAADRLRGLFQGESVPSELPPQAPWFEKAIL